MKLGKVQTLKVNRKVDFGVYLTDSDSPLMGETDFEKDLDEVLLPKNELDRDYQVGDLVEVFVMRDSKDLPIATLQKPLVEVGGLAKLEVKEVTKHGAFLNWGLGKDLFLPYKEQTYNVAEGDLVLVGLYLDKSARICSTMKVYDYLASASDLGADEMVDGTVYNINPKYGVFVAVFDKYHGLIQNKEATRPFKIGETITARIKAVREDGKLDLAVRKKSYMQIDDDAKFIEDYMNKNGGRIPYTDKASPDRIKADFSMSKNEFKRAIGRLLKEGKISINTDDITFVKIDKK